MNEPKRTLTDEQLEQLAEQISGYIGWRMAWYFVRYPLVFLCGFWAASLIK